MEATEDKGVYNKWEREGGEKKSLRDIEEYHWLISDEDQYWMKRKGDDEVEGKKSGFLKWGDLGPSYKMYNEPKCKEAVISTRDRNLYDVVVWTIFIGWFINLTWIALEYSISPF